MNGHASAGVFTGAGNEDRPLFVGMRPPRVAWRHLERVDVQKLGTRQWSDELGPERLDPRFTPFIGWASSVPDVLGPYRVLVGFWPGGRSTPPSTTEKLCSSSATSTRRAPTALLWPA
jgi:hypothetical protein